MPCSLLTHAAAKSLAATSQIDWPNVQIRNPRRRGPRSQTNKKTVVPAAKTTPKTATASTQVRKQVRDVISQTPSKPLKTGTGNLKAKGIGFLSSFVGGLLGLGGNMYEADKRYEGVVYQSNLQNHGSVSASQLGYLAKTQSDFTNAQRQVADVILRSQATAIEHNKVVVANRDSIANYRHQLLQEALLSSRVAATVGLVRDNATNARGRKHPLAPFNVAASAPTSEHIEKFLPVVDRTSADEVAQFNPIRSMTPVTTPELKNVRPGGKLADAFIARSSNPVPKPEPEPPKPKPPRNMDHLHYSD